MKKKSGQKILSKTTASFQSTFDDTYCTGFNHSIHKLQILTYFYVIVKVADI